MKQPYNTALYYRLSRDDEKFGDSVSIETQRTILQKYARENGFLWWTNTSTMAGRAQILTDRISSA